MDGLAWADAAKRRRATEREELLRQATPLADVVHGFVIEFVFARELRARPSGSNARGLSDASVLRYIGGVGRETFGRRVLPPSMGCDGCLGT